MKTILALIAAMALNLVSGCMTARDNEIYNDFVSSSKTDASSEQLNVGETSQAPTDVSSEKVDSDKG